jgi:hypothetical protein
MRTLAGFLLGVRRSDGQLASYRNDGVALGLHLLSLALLVATPLGAWLSDSLGSWWWALWLLSLTADILARMRLRRSVRIVEGLGAEATRSFDEQLMNRTYDFAARHSDIAEEKLLARAAEAEDRGDRQSADRYRRKADRERERAERYRSSAAHRVRTRCRKRNKKGSDEVQERSSGSAAATDGIVGAAHEVAEDATGDAGWLDGLDGLG